MIVSLYSESLGYCLHLIYLTNFCTNDVHTHTHAVVSVVVLRSCPSAILLVAHFF